MSSDEKGLYVRAQRFVTRITQGAPRRDDVRRNTAAKAGMVLILVGDTWRAERLWTTSLPSSR